MEPMECYTAPCWWDICRVRVVITGHPGAEGSRMRVAMFAIVAPAVHSWARNWHNTLPLMWPCHLRPLAAATSCLIWGRPVWLGEHPLGDGTAGGKGGGERGGIGVYWHHTNQSLTHSNRGRYLIEGLSFGIKSENYVFFLNLHLSF